MTVSKKIQVSKKKKKREKKEKEKEKSIKFACVNLFGHGKIEMSFFRPSIVLMMGKMLKRGSFVYPPTPFPSTFLLL